MAKLGVVHLVRAANGLHPLRAFLDSYVRFSAGQDHTLILVLKGFAPHDDTPHAVVRSYGMPYEYLHVSDEGFDLTAYHKAVSELEYDTFCFLNSYSRLLDHDWLAKLAGHSRRVEVGLVGATGSWESPLSWECERTMLPGPLFKDRIRHRLRYRLYRRYFAPFPNGHIRTNAFMISRGIMLHIRTGRLDTKLAAYRYENGKDSLTSQVQHLGLKTLVVGRDGNAYDVPDWPESDTFRHGDQRNLLVADNRTQGYMDSPAETQARLAWAAWGDRAELPSPRLSGSDSIGNDVIGNGSVENGSVENGSVENGSVENGEACLS